RQRMPSCAGKERGRTSRHGGDVRGLAFIVGAICFSVLARGSAPRREPSRCVHRATAVHSSVLKLPPVGLPAVASGATALGTLAIGSLAISALAVGALAVGRLEIRKTRLREVEIDELTVRRLLVDQQPGEGLR